MSKEEDKIKHSKRLLKDENAVKKQVEIAKAHGGPFKKSNGFAKTHAMTCGDSNCVMCGNPRKFFKEPTMQEKKFIQTEKWNDDTESNL